MVCESNEHVGLLQNAIIPQQLSMPEQRLHHLIRMHLMLHCWPEILHVGCRPLTKGNFRPVYLPITGRSNIEAGCCVV